GGNEVGMNGSLQGPPPGRSEDTSRGCKRQKARLGSLASRLVGVVLLVALAAAPAARAEPLRAVQVSPDQVTWVAGPRGFEQAVLVGDPSSPGPYVAHIKFPPSLKITPHFHPDDRVVTVLAGTVLFGYGERFEETAMRALPAGSVWTEPAGQPHFAWARDGEVVLQVIGFGPSGTT